MIGRSPSLGGASFKRRLATRAIVVLGAVSVGGLLMRSVPHEQTLIFPVGSVFPDATRFEASWKQKGDAEPRGGVTLSFAHAPPLQVRQHPRLPNGDYIVTVDILQSAPRSANAASRASETAAGREGLQTNIERRVSLDGGETLIALAVDPREPSAAE